MIFEGNNFVDERGTLNFVNEFNFHDVKRFYQVINHKNNYIRAWHGHKFETKYFYVSKGAILLGMVNLESEKISKYILTSSKPKIIKVPLNHANGFMNLTEKTSTIIFSDKTLEESKDDDIRFHYKKWDIWNIENY